MSDREVLRLTLLGGFEARGAGGRPLRVPSRKAQAVLAYLGTRPGAAHARDKLATLLWSEASTDEARNNFRQTLFALRRALGAAGGRALRVTGETVALDATLVDVDAARLDWLVAQRTPGALAEATRLYRGEFLEGHRVADPAFEEWLLTERARFHELAVDAHARLLVDQRRRDPEAAIQTALRLLALDPLQESTHRTLMTLYAESGRRAAALRQYQTCVDVLRRELDAEPESETQTLYAAILTAPPVVPAAGALAAAPNAAPPSRTLIGRAREMKALERAIADARRGRGAAVLILGEAGIGKSRVADEALTIAARGGDRALRGRAYESERGMAFGPWLDALRTGGVATDVPLVASLGGPARAMLARLFPELGEHVAGAAADAIESRMLLEAVDHLVARLTNVRPVALVLEDLHWADTLSAQLFAFVARRSQTRRMLLVATAREEDWTDSAARPALDELDRDGLLVRMPLAALTEAESLELARTLARSGTAADLERRLGARIWAMSAGNPFVVVETMRALADGATIAAGGTLPLPERVAALIASRLERLTPRARELTQAAAVVGRQFEFALVQRTSGLDVTEAAAAIEELVRRRVLHGIDDAFDFAHDRIRHVAYGQLLGPRRALLHRRAGEAIVDLHAGDLAAHYAALAYHFRAAGVSPAAVDYARRAGAQAMARGAYAEAVAFFDEALGQLGDAETALAEAIDLRLELRRALVPLGDVARIRNVLAEAEDLAQRLGDARRRAWVAVYRAHYGWLVGDYAPALRAAEETLQLADAVGDGGARMLADLYAGQIHRTIGDSRTAIRYLRRAVEAAAVADRSALGRPSIPALLWLVSALVETGAFAEARARGQESLRLAESEGHALHLAHAHLACGFVHLHAAEADRAIESLEHGYHLVAAGGFERSTLGLTVRALLACAYGTAGRSKEALALTAGYEPVPAVVGVPSFILGLFAEALLLADRLDAARRLARQALETARTRGERGYEAWTLRLLAEITAHATPLDVGGACSAFAEARTLAEALDAPLLVAYCRFGLGAVYARAGMEREARCALGQAASAFGILGASAWQARVDRVLATARG